MKKSLITIIAVCLLFLFSVVLFDGCSYRLESAIEPIITSDMTLEQVKEALAYVQIFSWEISDEEGLRKKYVLGANGFSNYGYKYNTQESYFIEDSRVYYFFSRPESEGECRIVDLKGYNYKAEDFDFRNSLDKIFADMKGYGYTIENETIYIEAKNEDGTLSSKQVIGEFNTARFFVPEQYEDNYKNLQPTSTVVTYADISETECVVTRDVYITLSYFEIPQTYNGKTVIEVQMENVDALVIPVSVRKITKLNNVKTIKYLGTAAQWEAIEKGDEFEYSGVVLCSDEEVHSFVEK